TSEPAPAFRSCPPWSAPPARNARPPGPGSMQRCPPRLARYSFTARSCSGEMRSRAGSVSPIWPLAGGATSPSRKNVSSGDGRPSRSSEPQASALRNWPSSRTTASSPTNSPAPARSSRCSRSPRPRPTPKDCCWYHPSSERSSPRSFTGSGAAGRPCRWSLPTTPTSGPGARRCPSCSSALAARNTGRYPAPPCASSSSASWPSPGSPTPRTDRWSSHPTISGGFATEALRSGLPPHIAAKILGHADLGTTMGYAAIYSEDVVAHHRAFIARRRALRPGEEYRDLTPEEWDQFLHHFELRKVALGVCTRDFGTPCVHEHSCVRCPQLRPDPA